MCGIIGYIGQQPAQEVLIQGLKRLEYRGYDSAGIAVQNGHGVMIRRAEGKLSQLEKLLGQEPLSGTIGIGHTRWATHGRPSENNAHPHRCQNIVVVHNGIIENHNELKKFLVGQGHRFESETDTEVICHLVHYYMKECDGTLEALRRSLERIRGSYAVAIMNEQDPSRLYIARQGSPLVVGCRTGESFVASDVPAILPYTRDMIFLEDGDIGVMRADGVEIFSGAMGGKVARTPQHIPWSAQMAERGGYKHFMLKEIFEQPDVFEDALSGRISVEQGEVRLEELDQVCGDEAFPFDEIVFIACGTSLHAGMVAKYLIESIARVRVVVDLASEFRYRQPIVSERSLIIPITQSGETADTIAASEIMKREGAKLLAICNALGTSITRLADATLYTHAGPEIGVASTKAFTTQLTVAYLLALDVARRLKRISPQLLEEHVAELVRMPRHMKAILSRAPEVRALAERYALAKQAIFIGRGLHYPVALEGALKLKEVSYLHAEGFAAGELKHGPIALVEPNVPVIAIATRGPLYEKMLSNIEEVKARGASVIALATAGDQEMAAKANHMFSIPEVLSPLTPLLTVLPLQLFAYYVADQKGTDIDQPRNLAKSVTVE